LVASVGSILLASLFLFEAVIVVPAARNLSGGIKHLLGRFHRLTCRTALWTLLVALISWFALSWLVASTMSGDDLIECLQSGDWLTVLTGTQFGHIWLFRVIVSLVFGIILWVVARTSGRQSFLQATLAGLSVIDLSSWHGLATAQQVLARSE
jgi:putative copper export protein